MISTFNLGEPQVEADTVRFSWHIDPATSLLQDDSIVLRFPAGTDLASVPRGLLWIAFLAVLHPIWMLLRPLRVTFPVTIDPADAACWQRLIEAGIETLEAFRGTAFLEPCVFFSFSGPALPQPIPRVDEGLCASSFSGGKDSLLQASVLRELGHAPLLVATTSERPPLRDHLTERRAEILRTLPEELGLPLVEVRTDARKLWENGYAGRLGYGLAVSELTDTHLYFASLLIAGAAAGATHLFLASEADVQTMDERDGTLIQSPHFMYSVATQAGLATLLAPYGITLTSLTSPLFNSQVQRLLWTRYPDAAAFQYSCWRVQDDGAACNACSQCLRIVLGILAAGGDPRRAGYDPDATMTVAATWQPKWIMPGKPTEPGASSRAHLSAQLIDTVRSIDPAFAEATLSAPALQLFTAFRERLDTEPSNPIGMRPSFSAFLDPLVRDRAMEIYTGAFPQPASDDDGIALARTCKLSGRFTTSAPC